MADSTISGLSAAVTAVRTMEVPVNKGGGENAKVTLEQIVNLVSDTISAQGTSITAVSDAVSDLLSKHNVLCDRVSANSGTGGGGSVTSAEVNTASAAATSVLNYVCAASVKNSAANSIKGLQSVINALSGKISDAEVHASAASAAVTSVDARVNTVSNIVSQHTVSINAISNQLSGISARSVGVSVKGIQSAITGLSNTISAVSAAVTSVDTRVNTVSNLVSQLIVSAASFSNGLSALNSGISSQTTAAASMHGLQSAINNLSARISQITAGAGLTSTQTSNMIGSVLCVNYSNRLSKAGTATTSIKGVQSAMDRMSNLISNSWSAGAAISANLTSVQCALASVGSIVTSIASAISLVSTTSAAGTAVGLQSVVNALSNRISAMASGISGRNSANTSVRGLQSVHDALSARHIDASAAATSVDARVTSVVGNITSGLGSSVIIGKNTNGHAMAGGAFANCSGLGVALAANGNYQIDGTVAFTVSVLTGTRFGFTYNTTGAGFIVKGGMDMRCYQSIIAATICAVTSTDFTFGHIGEAQMSTVATANISITGGASSNTYLLEIEGIIQQGNSATTLQLQAGTSAGSGGIQILAGSYIRAYRI